MKNRKGVTLVELLIVVLILGALAYVAVPRIVSSSTTAKKNACKSNVDTINVQLEAYYADNDAWPASLNALLTNTSYFPDGAPACPFGTSYSWNATTHRVADHNDTEHGL